MDIEIRKGSPNKAFVSEARDFRGPIELYRRNGFAVSHETEGHYVMRKSLK